MPKPILPEAILKAFDLEPAEAIKYLESKGLTPTWDWDELTAEAHRKAFTVAKLTNLDLLRTVHAALAKAQADGTTLKDFGDALQGKLESAGWWGKKEATSPTGETKTVQLGSPSRLQTIFRTNAQSSYMAGRAKAQAANVKARPFLQYVAVGDKRSRPAHAKLDGVVLPADDPFWATNYPPNGFSCRCRVRSLSQKQIDREGLTVTSSTKGPAADFAPDPGFGANPADADFTDYKPDLKEYPKEAAKSYEKALTEAPVVPDAKEPEPVPEKPTEEPVGAPAPKKKAVKKVKAPPLEEIKAATPTQSPAEALADSKYKTIGPDGFDPDKSDEIDQGLKRFVGAWSKENFAEWSKSLEPSERAALRGYKGPAYTVINADLRGIDLGSAGESVRSYFKLDTASMTADIDRAIAKGATSEDIKVWRSFSDPTILDAPPGSLTGMSIADKGFVSTTLNKPYAKNIGGAVIAEIRLPKGTNCAWMEGIHDAPKGDGSHLDNPSQEMEILLARGAQFRVISDVQGAGTRELVLELVVPDEAAAVATPKPVEPEPVKKPKAAKPKPVELEPAKTIPELDGVSDYDIKKFVGLNLKAKLTANDKAAYVAAKKLGLDKPEITYEFLQAKFAALSDIQALEKSTPAAPKIATPPKSAPGGIRKPSDDAPGLDDSKYKAVGPEGFDPDNVTLFMGKKLDFFEYAGEWAGKNFKDWSLGLSESEVEALLDYKGSGYMAINASLRAPDHPETKNLVKHFSATAALSGDLDVAIRNLDKAIAKGKTPDDIKVWRSFRDPAIEKAPPGSLVGVTISDNGFPSTTINKQTADDWDEAGTIAEIRLPKGTPCAWLENLDDDFEDDGSHLLTPGHEMELLLARGSTFRVLADIPSEDGGPRQLILELIPPDALVAEAKAEPEAKPVKVKKPAAPKKPKVEKVVEKVAEPEKPAPVEAKPEPAKKAIPELEGVKDYDIKKWLGKNLKSTLTDIDRANYIASKRLKQDKLTLNSEHFKMKGVALQELKALGAPTSKAATPPKPVAPPKPKAEPLIEEEEDDYDPEYDDYDPVKHKVWMKKMEAAQKDAIKKAEKIYQELKAKGLEKVPDNVLNDKRYKSIAPDGYDHDYAIDDSLDQKGKDQQLAILKKHVGGWATDEFNEWSNTLTEDEILGLQSYKGTMYLSINEPLRGDVAIEDFYDDKAAAIIRDLDRAIAKKKITQDVKVWRSFSDPTIVKAPPGSLTGSTFMDKGFVSTTLNKSLTDGWGGDIVAEIRIPEGTNCAWVDGIFDDVKKDGSHLKNVGYEMEILLARGSQFRVLSDIQGPVHRELILELIP